ncbi:MAG TPA: hypothetical protein VMV60_13925 [Thermoanaerobaculia bacterium]|nr:hypothetical protein [Thermoanaerobaculia bacterium]
MKNTGNTNGGSKVPAGFYFNRKNWEIVTISGKKGGVLPGDEKSDYLKVPAVAMLAGAPMLGAAFVVFLPVIGFALLAKAAWKKASRAVETPKPAPVRHN